MENRIVALALAITMIFGVVTRESSVASERSVENGAKIGPEARAEIGPAPRVLGVATPAALSVSAEYFLRIHGRARPWYGVEIDLHNIPAVDLSANTYTITFDGFVPGSSGGLARIEEPLAGYPWANRFAFDVSVSGGDFTLTLPDVNEAFFAAQPHHNRANYGNARRVRLHCTGAYPHPATPEMVLRDILVERASPAALVWSWQNDVLPSFAPGEIYPIWAMHNYNGFRLAASDAMGLEIIVYETEIYENGPEPPVFSHGAGFFGAPFYLTLSAEPGTIIRYTTDGSIPTRNSRMFTRPIYIHSPAPTPENSPMSVRGVGRYTSGWGGSGPIVSTWDYVPGLYYNGMVIRARAWNENGGSDTVTRSFFVERGERGRFNTQVLSVTVEPENFAGETTGLYRNWYRPGWPIHAVNDGAQTRQPVHVEVFCPDENLLLAQNAMAWVFGNWSRGNPKRSLRFNFNQGDGDVRNMPQLVPHTRRNFYAPTEFVRNFRHINARISDPGGSEMRESIVHAMSAPLRPTLQNSTYGAVFVNGEFWGMYCLSAHRHAHLIAEMYGVHRNSVELTDNTWPFHYRINAAAPFTNQANFDYLSEFIDMDNFIDYLLIGYHFDNWDWVNNNFEFWRTTEYYPDVYGGDTRWRFVVHDFDNGINHPANDMMRFFTSRRGIDPDLRLEPGWANQLRDEWAANTFIHLLENPGFRETFAARYSTYTGTAFHPSRANAVINRMTEQRVHTIGADMYRWNSHYQSEPWGGVGRWLTTFHPEWGSWMGWGFRSCVAGLREVLTRRADYSVTHIRDYFNRTDRPNLSMGLDDSGFTNIRFTTDYERGFFDIAGAQVRPDLFRNLGEYDFCVGDFNAEYIRGLPVEIYARAYNGYVFSHFEVVGGIYGDFEENPLRLTPPPFCGEPIEVNAVFEPALPPEYVVLMELTRTEDNAAADAGNRFNATGGLFGDGAFLTAHSGGRRRSIGVAGNTRRAPMVLNNFTDGWASVNPGAAHGHPDYGITPCTATAFEIRFETTGHENIRFSARQRSTGAGPDFFALAYRIGSDGAFTSIPGTRTGNRQSPPSHRSNDYSDFDLAAAQSFYKRELPPELANQRAVYLRVYMRESAILPANRANGNTSINDIVIIGDKMDGCFICAGECRLGDINGDGRITSADATFLARSLVDHSLQICTYAADFFGTGEITVDNLTLLARRLVGHRVTLDMRGGA